jgi:hypothetical protein
MNSAVPYMGTLDMSGRTSVMQLAPTQAFAVYGDWINGSGVAVNGGVGVTTFSDAILKPLLAQVKHFTVTCC